MQAANAGRNATPLWTISLVPCSMDLSVAAPRTHFCSAVPPLAPAPQRAWVPLTAGLALHNLLQPCPRRIQEQTFWKGPADKQLRGLALQTSVTAELPWKPCLTCGLPHCGALTVWSRALAMSSPAGVPFDSPSPDGTCVRESRNRQRGQELELHAESEQMRRSLQAAAAHHNSQNAHTSGIA